MSERQAEITMDHDNKPETGAGQSWIHSSLLHMGQSITSLTQNLGRLTRLYTGIPDREILSWKNTEEDNKRLIDLWTKPRNAAVVFISLHAFACKDDETKISQVGMSAWQPNNFDFIHSIYGQVEQGTISNNLLLSQATPGKFIWGETEVISDSDIGPWLQSTFEALRGPQNMTCLIGYDIRRILQLAHPYWSVPRGILIFETQAAQGFQIQTSEHLLSFQQTLRGANGFQLTDSQLDNAGNIAQLVLKSFQDQVRETDDNINRKKASLNIYMSQRGLGH